MRGLACSSAVLLLQVIRIVASQTNLCLNSPDFEFNYDGDLLTCEQIGAEERQRTKLCQEESIRENCPHICGICCHDDPNYTFQSKKSEDKNCEWLGERELRRFNYCAKNDQSGQKISIPCPKACNACKEYIPDDIPQYLLGITLPTNKEITSAPTLSPAPTVSNCVDQETFKHKEKFTCDEIRKDEFKRGNFCKNQDVRNACPITCGLCCADDDSYEFTSSSGKNYTCANLDNSVTELKFCETSHDGKMVKNACRSSCNNCMSRILPYRKEETKETEETNTDPSGGVPPVIGGLQTDEIIKTKVPAYLILCITFLVLGLLIGMYSIYLSQANGKAKREMEEYEENSEPQQKYVERYLSHSMSTAEPDAISVALSKEGMGEINNSMSHNTELHVIPEDSDSVGAPHPLKHITSSGLEESSFIAASITKLGRKNASQADVHKCLNFPCNVCSKGSGITFIKAPRANVERGPYGEVQFVPVPVNFISGELTEGLSPSDSLSVTSGLSNGMSVETNSNISTSDITGTSQSAGVNPITIEKKIKGAESQDGKSHSSMLMKESEV